MPFGKGARPVIYGTIDEIQQIPIELKWRCINLDPEYYDFSWLREWSIKGGDFDFSDYKFELIILAPTDNELKN